MKIRTVPWLFLVLVVTTLNTLAAYIKSILNGGK